MNKEDIYYIVELRDWYAYANNLPELTTIYPKFCAKLVNQNNGNFYFELNHSNALIIIPHNWIKWMAPSKRLNKRMIIDDRE